MQNGILAEAGPLTVFISQHLIPTDLKRDAASPSPCYVSDDQSTKISVDDVIRLRIVSTRVDATEIFALGSIKEDYMGLIS